MINIDDLTLDQIRILQDKFNIIGADEVGYGSLSGPLVICGVKAPKDWALAGLGDSKKLSEKKRLVMGDKLGELILKNEIQIHIAERSNKEIDSLGVAAAMKSCYVEIFHKLYCDKSLIIIDGNLKFDNLGVDAYDNISVVKADSKFPAVMAASIIAKNYRDGQMKKWHDVFPLYNWNKNMGYGAKDHLDAIEKYGPCKLHRYSYAPMKNLPEEQRTKFSQVSPGVGNRKDDI